MSETTPLSIVLTTFTESDGNLLPFDPDDFNKYADSYVVSDETGTWQLKVNAVSAEHAVEIVKAITRTWGHPTWIVSCTTTGEVEEITL